MQLLQRTPKILIVFVVFGGILLVAALSFLFFFSKTSSNTPAKGVSIVSNVSSKNINVNSSKMESFLKTIDTKLVDNNVQIIFAYQTGKVPDDSMIFKVSSDQKIYMVPEINGKNYKITIYLDKNRWEALNASTRKKDLQIAVAEAMVTFKDTKLLFEKNQYTDYLQKIYTLPDSDLWFSEVK